MGQGIHVLNLCLEVKKLPFFCCIYFLMVVTINMYKRLTLITDLILLGKLLLDGSVFTPAEFTHSYAVYIWLLGQSWMINLRKYAFCGLYAYSFQATLQKTMNLMPHTLP